MSFSEIIRSIFINIRENKSKVFLTTLGVIVGALTIVLVMAIGNGSQASVEEQFKRLNVGTLHVMTAFGRGGGTNLKLGTEDMEAITDEAASIKSVSMMINGNASISYQGVSANSNVGGVKGDFKEINNLELEYGEFINEDNSSDKVAVIGSEIVKLLFEEMDGSEVIGEADTKWKEV